VSYEVRSATREDLPALAAVERAAQALFAEAGMPELRDAPVLDLSEVERYFAEGFVAVATHPRDGVVGFVVVRPLGGCAHVQEIDVHPDHGHMGLGRRLLELALDWSRRAGYPAVTLTTFRDVAWNAPFYARCGFRELDPAQASPELLQLRAFEGTFLRNEQRLMMRVTF
jgi:GNAT superfamily N-acetyltransferase